MDADNANAQVAQGATNESAPTADELLEQYAQLAQDFPENSDGDLGDGDDGADGTPAGDGDGDDGSESSLDDELGDEGDGEAEEDDGDAESEESGDGETADGDPAPASEGEPAKEQVEPEPPKIDRKAERLRKEIEKYAKDNGYDSVEDMIGTSTGETADEVKKRLDSEDLTVEEKAALYDKEHAKNKETELADAERRGREAVLQALYADFPTIKDTVKDLDKDIKNPDRFLKLLLAGASPREAFLATGNTPPKTAPIPNGKAHLVPGTGARRGGGSSSLSKADLAYYRSFLGDDVTAEQIENYIKRVQ